MPGRPAVAIVGAGPAGLVIAQLLQREAIPCVVLERHTLADLGQHPKAGLIEYRTVASLQRERIAGPILEFSAENHRCEFRTPRESVVLDYGALTGGRPHYIYPQHQLVQRLCEALSETGGEIRFGHAVLAVTQDSGGAVLSVEGPDGRSYEMPCGAVAGCEGSKSVVAAAMNRPRSVSNACRPDGWSWSARGRLWKTTPSTPRIPEGSPVICGVARPRPGTTLRSLSPTPPPTGRSNESARNWLSG